MNTSRHSQLSPSEAAADAAQATAFGLRAVEVAVVVFGWLLVTPPFFVLAVVVVVPTALVLAVVLALVALLAAPTILVHRVLAHHREHHSTLFLHRLGFDRLVGGAD
jgi:uncharacterized membrane protein